MTPDYVELGCSWVAVEVGPVRQDPPSDTIPSVTNAGDRAIPPDGIAEDLPQPPEPMRHGIYQHGSISTHPTHSGDLSGVGATRSLFPTVSSPRRIVGALELRTSPGHDSSASSELSIR